MRLHMINFYQRNMARQRKGFCKRSAHKQRSQQSRSTRKSYCIYVIFMYFCLADSLIYRWNDILLMRTGCQFRHDTAELFMDSLIRDNIGANFSVNTNGGGGLIT